MVGFAENLDIPAGIQITTVQPNSPAEKAGLELGDIIFFFDNIPFELPSDSITSQFTSLLYKHRPGDVIELGVLRKITQTDLTVDDSSTHADSFLIHPINFIDELAVGQALRFDASTRWEKLDIDLTLGIRTDFEYPALPLYNELGYGILFDHETENVPLFNWNIESLQNKYKISKYNKDLQDRLQTIENGDDGFRFQGIATTHRNPEWLEKYSRYAYSKLGSKEIDDPSFLFDYLFELFVWRSGPKNEGMYILRGSRPPTPPVLRTTSDTSEFVYWFNFQISASAELFVTLATLNLTDSEKRSIPDQFHILTDTFSEHIYLQIDENDQRFANNRRLVEWAKTKLYFKDTKLPELSETILKLIYEHSPQILSWMSTHPDIRFLTTKYGVIGFGTEGRDRWTGDMAQFIFDPGGDDFYGDGCATATSFDQPVSFVVDFDGDDAYQSTSEFAQACGAPGIGLIWDEHGNDTYIAGRWAQGAGFFGAGILIDFEGDDVYRADEYAQGSGMFGYGLLVDKGGNDRYEGAVHCQGVGFPKGVGALIDLGGDDTGYCSGKKPTNYGDKGIFDAWGQGVGMGFRSIAGGGLGILIDKDGNDDWEGGNFSQGGGYYYGMGIFYAGGDGDDSYMGSRYGQGWSAHQAAGCFIEEGGNDRYDTRQGVVSGLAWDQSVSIFVDQGGDDYYHGGGFFSLGASAHNSICLFRDEEGKDTYDYKHLPGRAGKNDYHGGTSFSLFLDIGDEEDIYTAENAGNNIEIYNPEHGIFRDGTP